MLYICVKMWTTIFIVFFTFFDYFIAANNSNRFAANSQQQHDTNAYVTGPISRAKAHGSVLQPQAVNSAAAVSADNNKQIFIGVPTPPPVPRVPYQYGSKSISEQPNQNSAGTPNNGDNNGDNANINSNKQIFIGIPTPPPVPRIPYSSNRRSLARGVPQLPVNFVPTPPPIPPIPTIPHIFRHAMRRRRRRAIAENDAHLMLSNGNRQHHQQGIFPRIGSKYAYIIHAHKDAVL